MTNAEFQAALEELAEQAIVLVRDCGKDRTKINDGLWKRLCELSEQLDEYV